MSEHTFHDTSEPTIEVGVEPPGPKYTSKYQPLLDWCDANPGKWGRAQTSGSYVTTWTNRGYDVVCRSIEGQQWLYVRKPA